MGQYKDLFIEVEEHLGFCLTEQGMTNEQAINSAMNEVFEKRNIVFSKDTIKEVAEDILRNWQEEMSRWNI